MPFDPSTAKMVFDPSTAKPIDDSTQDQPFYQPLIDAGATLNKSVERAANAPTIGQWALREAGGAAKNVFNIPMAAAQTAGNLLMGQQNMRAMGQGVGNFISNDPVVQAIAKPISNAWNMIPNRAQEDIKDVANIGSLFVPVPLGKIVGSFVKDNASKAIEGVAEALNKNTGKDIVKSTLNDLQNAQAESAGIPLTRAQRANVVSGAQPTGVEGAIENTVSGLPGGQGVMLDFKKQQAQAAVKSLENVFGDKLQNIDENYAQKIVADIEQNHNLEKDAFHNAYANALDNGSVSYIHGQSVAKNALKKINQMPEATTLDPEYKTKVGEFLAKVRDIDQAITSKPVVGAPVSSTIEDGYRQGMSKAVLGQELAPRAMQNTNYDAYRSLQTELLGEKERAWNLVRAGGANKEQVRKYATVLGVISKKMKQNEYAHLRMVGGNDLVNNLKMIDSKYGDEVGSMSAVQKVLGLNKDIGEKGYKESEVALDALMNPKNIGTTKLAMDYMSPDTKQTFGKALLAKVIRPATKGSMTDGQYTANTIHLATLDNNFNKYRPGLETLLGKDRVTQFDNFLTAAKKARLQSVNISDAANPSGTGFKNAINNLITSVILGGGVGGTITHGISGGAVGVAGTAGLAGIGALGARTLAKRAIEQPRGLKSISKLGNILGNERGSIGAVNPQVYTPEFKQWFGDWEKAPEQASKVVDESGKPLTVFHGTNKKFNSFDKGKAGTSDGGPGVYDGFFFTDDAGVADRYAENSVLQNKGKKNIVEAHLNIKNPRVLDNSELVADGDYLDIDYEIKQAIKNGNDGLIAKNMPYYDNIGDESLENYYIPFSPNQIKSAIRNSGAFSKATNDIRGTTGLKMLAGTSAAGIGGLTLAGMISNRKKGK